MRAHDDVLEVGGVEEFVDGGADDVVLSARQTVNVHAVHASLRNTTQHSNCAHYCPRLHTID